MQVINIHKRTIHQSKEKVSQVLKTLASENDLVWPYESWPAMKFKDGLKIGSRGGHGLVRYTIVELIDDEHIKFKFSKPEGFNGTHELRIKAINSTSTEILHEIKAKTSFKASLFWIFVIRWLHDALIEDAFDKVENYFDTNQKKTEYNIWVKILRASYKRKSFQTKHA